MFFYQLVEVEFVGGPFDGHRQATRASSGNWQDVIAIPVNGNVFRIMAGSPGASQSPVNSFALYELRKHEGDYCYHFVGRKSPKEFGVENLRI